MPSPGSPASWTGPDSRPRARLADDDCRRIDRVLVLEEPGGGSLLTKFLAACDGDMAQPLRSEPALGPRGAARDEQRTWRGRAVGWTAAYALPPASAAGRSPCFLTATNAPALVVPRACRGSDGPPASTSDSSTLSATRPSPRARSPVPRRIWRADGSAFCARRTRSRPAGHVSAMQPSSAICLWTLVRSVCSSCPRMRFSHDCSMRPVASAPMESR